jgi:hypothetical protein
MILYKWIKHGCVCIVVCMHPVPTSIYLSTVFVNIFPFRKKFSEHHGALFVFAIIFFKTIDNFAETADFYAAARICSRTHIFAKIFGKTSIFAEMLSKTSIFFAKLSLNLMSSRYCTKLRKSQRFA